MIHWWINMHDPLMARIRKTSDIGCMPTSELQKLDQNLRQQYPNFPRSGFASTKTLIASSSCSSNCLGVHLFPWHQVTNSPWSFWSILVHTSSSYRTKATKRVETTPVYHRSTRSTSLNMILRSRRQICRARVYLYGIGFLVCWYGTDDLLLPCDLQLSYCKVSQVWSEY